MILEQIDDYYGTTSYYGITTVWDHYILLC